MKRIEMNKNLKILLTLLFVASTISILCDKVKIEFEIITIIIPVVASFILGYYNLMLKQKKYILPMLLIFIIAYTISIYSLDVIFNVIIVGWEIWTLMFESILLSIAVLIQFFIIKKN
jgi:hypothetical protein